MQNVVVFQKKNLENHDIYMAKNFYCMYLKDIFTEIGNSAALLCVCVCVAAADSFSGMNEIFIGLETW